VEEGIPTKAAIVKQTEAALTFQFNRYPSEAEMVEMDYITVPPTLTTGTTDLIMPVQHRVVPAEFALSILLEGVDDDRATKHLKAAQAGFRSMVNEAQGMKSAGNRDFGRVVPREDESYGENRYVRTESGFIIDMGY
jgi:hypothetical protein